MTLWDETGTPGPLAHTPAAPARPRLLDLFCGAGGASMGYHRAGFDVVGVDLNPQPDYPFPFHRLDALEFATLWGDQFDAIHASPPCQRYSAGAKAAGTKDHPDLYAPTRAVLAAIGKPYVIENVIGAPYSHGFVLCGSMFDMRIQRHRNFETSWLVLMPFGCDHSGERPITITGRGARIAEGVRDYEHSRHASRELWPELMGMPWAPADRVAQAIPPAYTEWIGEQLLREVAR